MSVLFISTFTLVAEFFVSVSIFYTFYSAYKHNKFPYILVGITLAYEILFNISYMAYRAASGKTPGSLASPFETGLAIFHGSFSLLMFLALLVFMGLAWKNYKKGVNYFQVHKHFTIAFIILWLIAVLSGGLFYYVTYYT